MNVRWILAGLLVLVVPAMGLAQDETPAGSASKQKVEDQVSYILGFNLGANLKDDPFQIDIDRFVKGFRDALDGAEPELTEDQMQEIMQTFQQQMLEHERVRMEEEAGANEQEGAAYLDQNKSRDGVKTTASGLQYEVIKEGKGPKPAATDTVTVHYSGTLIDGTKFDSSYDRGEPATFPVSGVIPGWTEALQLMTVGSTWKIAVPSNLAYGPRGAGGVIGANETLLFDVELLSIAGGEE